MLEVSAIQQTIINTGEAAPQTAALVLWPRGGAPRLAGAEQRGTV